MFEERIEHLLDCWKKAFGQYANLKAEAEQAVVCWEWTTGERYSELPFYFQRFPGRGRVLKEAPTSEGNFIQYGFDGQGRVRLHRFFEYRWKKSKKFLNIEISKASLSEGLFSETFYLYSCEHIECIEFSVFPHIPRDIQQIFLESGRVSFFGHFELNGYTPLFSEKGKNPQVLYEWLGYNGRFTIAEAYEYEDNRLKMISGYYEVPGIPPYSANEICAYDDKGKLLRIDRLINDGEKRVVYRRRNKDQTFQTIREAATRKLVESIIQSVTAAKFQDKLYCIVLSYLSVSNQFPPELIMVPESYRLELLQSADPGARYSIFIPIYEKEWFLSLDDPETLEMCQVLEQEIRAGEKWDTATQILRDVAATLTRLDWSKILNVTPDFVIYALDPELEGDQIVEILSSSVSKKQIQDWIDKGWLLLNIKK